MVFIIKDDRCMKSLLGKLICGLIVIGMLVVSKLLAPVTIFLGIGGLVLILVAGVFFIALNVFVIIMDNLCALYEKVTNKKTPLPILKFLGRIDQFTTNMLAKYESIK